MRVGHPRTRNGSQVRGWRSGRLGAGQCGVAVDRIWARSVPVHPGEGRFADVTEFGRDIIDYVRGAGFEPKVFLSHEVSADYTGPCGEDSVISSDVHEEVLTAVSRGPSRAGPWSLSCEGEGRRA